MALTPIRGACLALLQSLVAQNLTEDDEAFQKLVDPNDDPAREALVAKESCCGLCALGEQDELFDLPPRPAYVNASAFVLVNGRAAPTAESPVNAKHVPDKDTVPQPADWIEWDKSPTGACAHIEAVTEQSWEDEAQTILLLTCVAGGERTGAENPPAGRETIKIMKRRLHFIGGRWVDTANGRPLLAFFDCDDMAIKYGPRS